MTIHMSGTRTRRTLIQRARVAGESEGTPSTEPEGQRASEGVVSGDLAEGREA